MLAGCPRPPRPLLLSPPPLPVPVSLSLPLPPAYPPHPSNPNPLSQIAVIMNELGESGGVEGALAGLTTGGGTAASGGGVERSGRALEEWVEVANGCLCCSVKSDFVAALDGLLTREREKKMRGASDAKGIDLVVIETTGLADPGPVCAALWTDAEVAAGSVVLDAVVTVADATRLKSHLGRRAVHDGRMASACGPGDDDTALTTTEAHRQLAHADVVILTRADRLGRDGTDPAVPRAAAEALVRSINPTAEVRWAGRDSTAPTSAGGEPAWGVEGGLGGLLLRGAYVQPGGERKNPPSRAPTWAAAATWAAARGGALAPTSTSATGLAPAVHATAPGLAVRAHSLTYAGPLDRERFRTWLDALLWRSSDGDGERYERMTGADDRDDGSASAPAAAYPAVAAEVLRIKGVADLCGGWDGRGCGGADASTSQSTRATAVQAVGEAYDLVDGGPWSGLPGGRGTALAVIGRGLDPTALAAGLAGCAVGGVGEMSLGQRGATDASVGAG